MNLIETINQIEADKISRKIEPAYTTVLELLLTITDETNDNIINELNRLHEEDKIFIGKTINGYYINIL